MSRFTLPRDLYHGKGSLEALKTLSGKRAIVVVGGLVTSTLLTLVLLPILYRRFGLEPGAAAQETA